MSAIEHQGSRPTSVSRTGLMAVFGDARRSRLLRNILTLMSGTAAAQAVTMAFMPVITRLFGPQAYGVLGTFLSLQMILIPVAALTYPMAIVLPRHDREAQGLARLSLGVAALVAVLVAVLLALFGDAAAEALNIAVVAPYLLLLPLVMFAGAALEVAQQWLFRLQRFKVTAKVAVVHAALFNGLRVIAGLIHPSAAVLVTTTAGGPAMQTLMLALGIRRGAHARPTVEGEAVQDGSLALARRFADFPLYRAPTMLINTCSQHMPTLVLAAFFGPVAAGFFALCKQVLSVPTNLIGKSVTDVYYPRMTQAIHAGEPIARMLAKATASLALLGLVPFGLVFLAGPTLFAWVFGSEWQVAGEFARWLALAEYSIFLTRPSTVVVPALGLQRGFLFFELASTALRIGALMVGAMLIGDATATVQAFAAASVVIYLSLMGLVLMLALRWHRRRGTAGTVSTDGTSL